METISVLLIFICCSGIAAVSVTSDRSIVLQVNKITYTTIHLDATTRTWFIVDKFPANTSYLVLQIHAYDKRLELSTSGTYDLAYGRDIGLVKDVPEDVTSVSWYVESGEDHEEESPSAVTVLVLATSHTHQEPLIGGCSKDYISPNDTNLWVEHSFYSNFVNFEYSKQASPGNDSIGNCDVQKNLRYTMYQRYMGGSGSKRYFEAISQMLLVHDMAENGQKVKAFNYNDEHQGNVAAFVGKGVVYNVVVQDVGAKTSAAYVPVVAYGCERTDDHDDVSCDGKQNVQTFGVILMVALGLIGVFLCFFGHRWFTTEMFIFGYLGSLPVIYIMFAWPTLNLEYETPESDMLNPDAFEISAWVAVSVGVALIMPWYFYGKPRPVLFVVGLVSGYLLSSVIFNLTPLKDVIWWQKPVNYGLAFIFGTLIIPVLMLAFPRTLNLLSCSFVGGYLAVLAIDIFVKGNVSQIILLSFRKAVWDGFLKVEVIPPYQWTDVLLFIIWGLLTVAGGIFQYIRERDREPFPPCPWDTARCNRNRREVTLTIQRVTAVSMATNQRDSTNNSPEGESDNERTPLIVARSTVMNIS